MNKIKTTILITVFIIACVAICGLFSLFSNNSDMAPSILPQTSLGFVSDTGETVDFSGEDIYEHSVRTDGVYTLEYTVSGEYKTLVLSMGAGEAEIFVNGECVYSGNMPDGQNLTGPNGISFSVNPQNSEDMDIVIKTRYTDPYNYIFPALLQVNMSVERDVYLARLVTPTAILAGISGICFLLSVGMFLMSIYYSNPDWSLIFLGIASITYCICRIQETGAVVLPDFIANLTYSVFRYIVAPAVLLFIILNRKKRVLKYILVGSGIVAGLIILANILTIIFDRVPAIFLKLRGVAQLISKESFSEAIVLLSNYLILVCALAMTGYHVRYMAEVRAEKNALESQNRAIVSAYKNIVAGVRRTAEVRHEWKHDLMTLSLLYEQGRIDDIGKYLNGKSGFIKGGERLTFAECPVLDVILNAASSRALEENVKLSVQANTPAKIGVREEDLCQLVMNMFDNAFNACSQVDENDRYISFSAVYKNGYLNISCINSCAKADRKTEKDITQHGFGIITMKKICSRYGSELVINRKEKEFAVMTSLQTEESGS